MTEDNICDDCLNECSDFQLIRHEYHQICKACELIREFDEDQAFNFDDLWGDN